MNEVVRYQNNFIEAVYSMGLIEKKLLIAISLLVQNGSTQDAFQEVVYFTPEQVCSLVGISTESHKEIDRATTALMKTVITVRQTDKPKNWIKFPMLTRGEYSEGSLKIRVAPEMKQYLFDFAEKYTAYHLENIKPLRSTYSIRIYELLKEHEKQENKQCEFTIAELRNLLGIGVDEYKLYGDFKRYIIERAKDDLKKKTDIKFSYKEEKLGRSVHKLIFKISENTAVREKRKSQKPKQTSLLEI